MRAGHYLEDAVARFYADQTGATIINASAGDWFFINDLRPYLQISPDRTAWPTGARRNETSKIIIECKTTQLTIDPDDVPDHWYLQLQYQLGVAEIDHGALAWLTQGRNFGYKEFDFEQNTFDFILRKLDDFWQRYIIGNEIPPDINAADTQLRYPAHAPGKRFTADLPLAEKIADLRSIKKEIEPLEKKKKEIESEIKMSFNDNEAMYDTYGNLIATWKAPKPSAKFDEKTFAKDFPDIYNQYCTQYQPARKLIIK